MNASVKSSRAVLVGVALLALGAGACSHDIGDSCQTSVDCDPSGTRACDLSQPGGYCTINGCDETTCPSGATCVRYFPVALLMMTTDPPAVHCDPACEDIDCPADAGATDADATDAEAGATDARAEAGATDARAEAGATDARAEAGATDARAEASATDARAEAGATDAGTHSGRQDNCTADEVCLDVGLCAKRSYEQRECAKVCSSNADCRSGYDCRETGVLGSMPLSTNPLATTKFCAPHAASAPPL